MRQVRGAPFPFGGRVAYKRHHSPAMEVVQLTETYPPAASGRVGPKARGGQDAEPSPSLRLDSPRGRVKLTAGATEQLKSHTTPEGEGTKVELVGL